MKTRHCKIKNQGDKLFLFHQFSMNSIETNDGIVHYPVGIVEDLGTENFEDSGKILLIDPVTDIKFT